MATQFARREGEEEEEEEEWRVGRAAQRVNDQCFAVSLMSINIVWEICFTRTKKSLRLSSFLLSPRSRFVLVNSFSFYSPEREKRLSTFTSPSKALSLSLVLIQCQLHAQMLVEI